MGQEQEHKSPWWESKSWKRFGNGGLGEELIKGRVTQQVGGTRPWQLCFLGWARRGKRVAVRQLRARPGPPYRGRCQAPRDPAPSASRALRMRWRPVGGRGSRPPNPSLRFLRPRARGHPARERTVHFSGLELGRPADATERRRLPPPRPDVAPPLQPQPEPGGGVGVGARGSDVTERPRVPRSSSRLEPQDLRSQPASALICGAMEALGPGGNRASPASSTSGLDLRHLSMRGDSAYSSFSAASSGPEPRTPSPGTDLLPYLDWDYVRVVCGGLGPAPPDAALSTSPRARPAVAAHSGPQPPEVPGTLGPLNRQATPLLYALAAEAKAATRDAEPPSPPASRAAYRQRLQGAQRRVLRATSFQRKELRMSLPARLRPTVPARPPATHPRSASLSHPDGEGEPARSRAPAPGTAGRGPLANQQRKWCFSEPGKLDSVGRGGGPAGECLGEACCSSGLPGPEPLEFQHPALAKFDHQVGWLPETQPQGSTDPDSGSLKLGDTYGPASRSRSASGEVLGSWGGSEGTIPIVQAVPQGAETPRPLFQTKFSRFLPQKEAAVVYPAEVPQSSPADGEQRVSETCIVHARLPSLPDEVFLEEAPLVRMRSPPDPHAFQGPPASVHASDQQYGTGLGQRTGQAAVPPEYPLHEYPGTAGADDCWQGVNGSVGISRPTSHTPTGTANDNISTVDPTGLTTNPPTAAESDLLKPLPVDALGLSGNDTPGPPHKTALDRSTGQPGSRPPWPSQCLGELVQELARLDPSLLDPLASQPSPEPPLGLLDGLIPLAEVRAAMPPACGEAGEEAASTFEPGSYQFSFTQLLPAPQEETRLENPATHPVPDQPCGQGLLAPNNSIQGKKVELAALLQKMLQDLHTEQERLQGEAQAWARRQAALEAAVRQACAPRELERFSRFMADLERVLGLLLLLGSRLARVRRALARAASASDPDEQASLLQRLRLLQRQEEDAKELKDHVARRERAVREVLVRALPVEELRAYCALLAGKAAVLAQQRSLDERIRLLQDQLDAIRDDLGHHPPSPSPARPLGTCPPVQPPFPLLLT
ncbi:protein Shroom1 [Theropithecus gelada]|uniref:Shroom family member 1 n=1 Tax=Theropithecus gelada TaxID=9565 RepID=A0A8D2FS74_THEGE|nr:protein Shroom1 [Theropithecus gelada]